MSFGDAVRPAESVAAADWIRPSISEFGTVGGLVPNQYESLLRIYAPESVAGDWWALYRDLFVSVGAVGRRYTSTPNQSWFAIWDGHGFASGSMRIFHPGPLTDEERRALEREQERLRLEEERRHAAIREYLTEVPAFELPSRRYYLVDGPIDSVVEFEYPGFTGWRNPDLWWPGDRSWFVGTDVDFWSLYIGGTREFLDELVSSASTETQWVSPETRLENED